MATEHELMREFGVSRNTVRLALDVLTRTNLVRRHQGRGTFVAPQGVSHVLGGLRSFTQVIQDLGRTPGIDAVTISPDRDAPPEAVSFLPGSYIWRVQRIRTSDGAPFALMQSWLPDATASQITRDELLESQSLYQVIEKKLGIRPASATEIIRAEAATTEESKLLDTDEGGPLLTIYRWTSGEHGQPIEYVRSCSPGDRYDFVVKLEQ
jgi:GntR family transcriptional regulator